MITYQGKQFEWQQISYQKEARRKWHIFQELKEKNRQPRILYPVKISFKNEGYIKTFSDERNLRECFACLERMATGSSPSRNGVKKEGIKE